MHQKGVIGIPVLLAFLLGLLMAGAGSAYLFFPQSQISNSPIDSFSVHSFEECMNAGYMMYVTSSIPGHAMYCTTPDGRRFDNPANLAKPMQVSPTQGTASNIQLYSVRPGITEDGTSNMYMNVLGTGFSSAKNFVTFTPQDPSLLPAYDIRSIALPSYAQGTAINLTLDSSQFSYGACRTPDGMCQGNITGFPAGSYYVSVTSGDCTGTNCESNKVLVKI